MNLVKTIVNHYKKLVDNQKENIYYELRMNLYAVFLLG